MGSITEEEHKKDRRLTPCAEMYELVCKERFQSINDDIADLKKVELDPMRRDLAEVREKVINGLSDLPSRVNWMLGILILFLLGVGGLAYTSGRNQARMETMFETYVEKSEIMFEKVEGQ